MVLIQIILPGAEEFDVLRYEKVVDDRRYGADVRLFGRSSDGVTVYRGTLHKDGEPENIEYLLPPLGPKLTFNQEQVDEGKEEYRI